VIWASKPSRLRFVGYATKSTGGRGGGGGDSVGHASRSSSLLHVESSRARVSQSGLKTGGGATMGDARGTITEVASRTS
jgi:hypothetical protein